MADIKVGTIKEFAEEIANRTYDSYDEKELYSFIFLNETNLSKDEVTDEEIDKADVCWYGVQTIEMFGCIYLCFGKWGGHSGVSITSPEDYWYTEGDRESYIESIIYKLVEVGDYAGRDINEIVVAWESEE